MSRYFVIILILISFAHTGYGAPTAGAGYKVDLLVPGSDFCGVHGLAVDSEDRLFAGSVVGQRIYQVNTQSGSVDTLVLPPKGMADDIEFLPDGTMVWTSISQNVVRAQSPGGEIRDLARLASVNSLAYRETDGKLFVAQVFGGDGLWEVDVAGKKEPRNILRDLGGLNGFDIGPDGFIYGPLWFKQQVVKINPDTSELTVLADGFHTPAAANFDSKWNLYVLDTGLGQVFKVNIKTGEKTPFVQLKPSLDNLAINSKDMLYISNMADNSIQAVTTQGEVTTLVTGGLSCPTGLSVAGNKVYTAEIFALREIDGDTGTINELDRSHAADAKIAYATAVFASDKNLYVMSSGALQQYQRENHQLLQEWRGKPGIQSLVELANGDLVVLSGGNTLTRLKAGDFNQQSVITDQLRGAASVAIGDDKTLYVSQPTNNNIIAVTIDNGASKELIGNLQAPRGLTIANNGDLIVMESAGRIVRINASNDQVSEIASQIPVGNLATNATTALGVGIDVDDNIYVLADKENAVYKISPSNNNSR